MTRLLRSEIRRLTARRLVRWMLLVWLALLVLLIVIVAVQSDADSPSSDEAIRTTQLWLSKAMAAETGEVRDNVVPTISVLTYLLVIVIGASAIGAEYRAGTVTTILTWETRRVRLLLARLAAAALVSMVFFVIAHAVLVGGWTLAAALVGQTDGANAEFWRELVIVLARATLIAGVLAVLSGALTTLGRNTAAAMGIWFGYLVAVEGILGAEVPDLTPWFLIPNLAGLYEWDRIGMTAGQAVTPGAGTARTIAYLVVLGGMALIVFRRRDVT